MGHTGRAAVSRPRCRGRRQTPWMRCLAANSGWVAVTVAVKRDLERWRLFTVVGIRIWKLGGPAGIEPATLGLKVRCSTAELRAHDAVCTATIVSEIDY